MVKSPVNIHSWKSTTIRVEITSHGDVSTAAPASAPRVVSLSSHSMPVGRPAGLDMSNVNRSLRGHREPVVDATGISRQRETA